MIQFYQWLSSEQKRVADGAHKSECKKSSEIYAAKSVEHELSLARTSLEQTRHSQIATSKSSQIGWLWTLVHWAPHSPRSHLPSFCVTAPSPMLLCIAFSISFFVHLSEGMVSTHLIIDARLLVSTLICLHFTKVNLLPYFTHCIKPILGSVIWLRRCESFVPCPLSCFGTQEGTWVFDICSQIEMLIYR